MVKLSQQDARWAQVKLGQSNLTVGRYGCTTTCLSMLSEYFGAFKTPAQLAGSLKYTPDGLIIWQSLPSVLPFKIEKRITFFSPMDIEISLKDPNKGVILNVNNGAHWVLATYKIPFTNKLYMTNDPWTGTSRASFAYKNIVGSAHMIKL